MTQRNEKVSLIMNPEFRQKIFHALHNKLIKVYSMGNDVEFIPEALLRMSSPFLSTILTETENLKKELTIYLPDFDRKIILCLKNILLKGEGSLNSPNLKDVKVVAQNLGINLNNLSIEPSKAQVVVKDEPVIPKLEKIKSEPTEYFESDIENVTIEKTELEHIKVENSPLTKYEKSTFSLNNMNYNTSKQFGKIEGTKVHADISSNFPLPKTENIAESNFSIDALDKKSKGPGGRKLHAEPKKLEASTKAGYCWPCREEFPFNEMNIHLLDKHKDEKSKPRSCTICNNHQLMSKSKLRRHRQQNMEMWHKLARLEKKQNIKFTMRYP